MTPEPDARLPGYIERGGEMTPEDWRQDAESEADVAAVRAALSGARRRSCLASSDWRDAVAALDRLAVRLQETERLSEKRRLNALHWLNRFHEVRSAEAREKALREALDRIADPVAEWQAHKIGSAGVRLPYEIARAALAATEELE